MPSTFNSFPLATSPLLLSYWSPLNYSYSFSCFLLPSFLSPFPSSFMLSPFYSLPLCLIFILSSITSLLLLYYLTLSSHSFFFIPPPSAFTCSCLFYFISLPHSLLLSIPFSLFPCSLNTLPNSSSSLEPFPPPPPPPPPIPYFLYIPLSCPLRTPLISSFPPLSSPLSTFSSSSSTHFMCSLIYSFLHYVLTTVFSPSFPLSPLSYPSTPLFPPRKWFASLGYQLNNASQVAVMLSTSPQV